MESQHEFQIKTCGGGVPWVEWNWQATCTCGWRGYHGTTKARARREWREHKKEV